MRRKMPAHRTVAGMPEGDGGGSRRVDPQPVGGRSQAWKKRTRVPQMEGWLEAIHVWRRRRDGVRGQRRAQRRGHRRVGWKSPPEVTAEEEQAEEAEAEAEAEEEGYGALHRRRSGSDSRATDSALAPTRSPSAGLSNTPQVSYSLSEEETSAAEQSGMTAEEHQQVAQDAVELTSMADYQAQDMALALEKAQWSPPRSPRRCLDCQRPGVGRSDHNGLCLRFQSSHCGRDNGFGDRGNHRRTSPRRRSGRS